MNENINFNQYNKLLSVYNTTLREYREALQKGDSYTVNQKYHDLVETSGKLKAEFTEIQPKFEDIKDQYFELKSTYDELKSTKDKFESAYDKLVTAYNNVINEHATSIDQYTQTGSQDAYNKMNRIREKLDKDYEIKNEAWERLGKAQERLDKAGSELDSFRAEFEFNRFVKDNINLIEEQKEIRIHYNETRSEGDLITKEQRQQDAEVYNEMRAVGDQLDSLNKVLKTDEVDQEVRTLVEYKGNLNGSELATRVLDDHAFYRLITSKQYTNEQFSKIEKEISENLAKKPMTIGEIIKFCEDNGIPHLSDDEFHSLIKNENKAYEDTNQSVRDIADYHYIAKNSEMTVSYQTPDSHSRGNINTATIVDADSFYKFIDTKMLRGGYTGAQEHKLYVDISEVLVHSPLTKGKINEIYYKHNISPPTEGEWSRLIERQESRRETDHISKNSDNLKFQGNVDIDVEDQNFKLKVDLYYRDKFDNKIKASQDEDKSNSKFSGKPERDPIQSNNEFQPDINNIQNILLETTKAFNESFGIRKSADVANFRVFIFDDAENHLKYSKEARGHANTSDNSNTANVYLFFGDNNYNDDNDLLRHEFTHALTFHATSKLGLSRTFMEGIAEYIVGKMHGKSNADFVKMIPEENFKFSIEHLVKYTPNENDHYVTGAAIVAYLEENHPNFLDNLLYAASDAIKSDRHIDIMEMMHKFFEEQGNKSLGEIAWFKEHATSDQLNGQQETNSVDSQAYYHSGGGYSGPLAQAKILNKENTIKSTTQPETQKPIVLNFNIEMNKETGQHQLVLIENSKGFIRDAFGDNVQFNNLDLPDNFSVWHNGYASRDELYVRDSNGNVLASNLSLNHYGLSVEVSSDGSRIVDHGIYPLAVIHNPDFYGKDYKEQNKRPSGLDGSKFLQDIENNLLSIQTPHGAFAQMYADESAKVNMFAQISSEVAAKEKRGIEKQKQAEKEFNKENAELKRAIKEGDIVIYKVREKANPNDDEHSSVVLKMTKNSQKALDISDEDNKNIKLSPDKFYITEIKTQGEENDLYAAHVGKYLYSVKGNVNTEYGNLFYVLNKNDPSESGFYNLGKDKFKFPAKYLDTKFKYISDHELHDKLLSNLELNHSKQQYAYMIDDEQMQSDQPHEDIVLKDTILSISKSDTADKHGRYKAEIKVEYKDIESLYNNAPEAEKDFVIKFWHKLHGNNYKIGDLPGGKYYFKGDKFIIQDKHQGNSVKLSAEKISLQLMHLKDHQGKDHLELVVLNKADGKVIGNIHEIDNLSYGLLKSDSDILSHLETHKIQDDLQLQFSEHHDDYDTYLTNGLEAHIFGHFH